MTDEERRREALFEQATEGTKKVQAKAEARKRKPKSANGEPPSPPSPLEEHSPEIGPNGGIDWQARALKTGKGTPMAVFANAVLALESDPAFAGLLGFDEFSLRMTLRRKLPDDPAAFVAPRQITDLDVLAIQGMLQWRGLPRISRQTTNDAIQTVAKAHRFHPIRDWLNGLDWNGTPLLPVWLTRAAGAPDDEYHRQVASLFPLAMVARVMQPGCKCDYMPVLEGQQGILKSSLCSALAGEAYFDDQLPPLTFDGVRFSMHLRGRWLVEMSELASMAKSQVEDLKSSLVRRVENYTPKYGHYEVHEPRQCTFIGTTNRDDYGRDETGQRRFWPVKTSLIEIGWMRDNREQLFAEAVLRFREGKPWWPDRELEQTLFVPQQAARYAEDVWTPKVVKRLEAIEADAFSLGLYQTPDITLAEVAAEALEVPVGKLGRAEQLRLSAIFTQAGWERGERTAHARPWLKVLASRPEPGPTEPPP